MSELTEKEKVCTLALIHTPGIGSVTIRQLISYCGGASEVFRSEYKKLIRIPGIGEKVARAILARNSLNMAEAEYRKCIESNTGLHFFTDPSFPSRLKSLYDAPIVLYSRGNIDFNTARTVGMSEQGKSVNTESRLPNPSSEIFSLTIRWL